MNKVFPSEHLAEVYGRMMGNKARFRCVRNCAFMRYWYIDYN
jgi:hypothetical protein